MINTKTFQIDDEFKDEIMLWWIESVDNES